MRCRSCSSPRRWRTRHDQARRSVAPRLAGVHRRGGHRLARRPRRSRNRSRRRRAQRRPGGGMSDAYQEFLANKARAAAAVGFDVQPDRLPEKMKAFQAAITGWALRRGCAALFEGTGLGKTVQELAWAQEVRGETKKPVRSE